MLRILKKPITLAYLFYKTTQGTTDLSTGSSSTAVVSKGDSSPTQGNFLSPSCESTSDPFYQLMAEKVEAEVKLKFDIDFNTNLQIPSQFNLLVSHLNILLAKDNFNAIIPKLASFFGFSQVYYPQHGEAKIWAIYTYAAIANLDSKTLEKHDTTKAHICHVGMNYLLQLNQLGEIHPEIHGFLFNQFAISPADTNYNPGSVFDAYTLVEEIITDKSLTSKIADKLNNIKKGIEKITTKRTSKAANVKQASTTPTTSANEESSSGNWWYVVAVLVGIISNMLTLRISINNVREYFKQRRTQPAIASPQMQQPVQPAKKKKTHQTPIVKKTKPKNTVMTPPPIIDRKKELQERLIKILEKMIDTTFLKEFKIADLKTHFNPINNDELGIAFTNIKNYSPPNITNNKLEREFNHAKSNLKLRLLDLSQLKEILLTPEINEKTANKANTLLSELREAHEKTNAAFNKLNESKNKNLTTTAHIGKKLRHEKPKKQQPVNNNNYIEQPYDWDNSDEIAASNPLRNSGKQEIKQDELQDENSISQADFNKLIDPAKKCKENLKTDYDVNQDFSNNNFLDMPSTKFARAMYQLACELLKVSNADLPEEIKDNFDSANLQTKELETIFDEIENNTDFSAATLIHFATKIMQFFQHNVFENNNREFIKESRRKFARN